jgi:phosphoribosylanthranilate isomerase
MQNLKIKVCGMRDPANIMAVASLSPDFMGFIFYEKSKRYAAELLSPQILDYLPSNYKKVGVFVDATLEKILDAALSYNLDFVQLHGSESSNFCEIIKAENIGVFKSFSVDENFDFTITESYENAVDYFLFDTKTEAHGGSGKAFDWEILKKYNQKLPFLLAGGLSLENIEKVFELTDLNILGVDVNSKFEIEPGLKDTGMLNTLFEKIRKNV